MAGTSAGWYTTAVTEWCTMAPRTSDVTQGVASAAVRPTRPGWRWAGGRRRRPRRPGSRPCRGRRCRQPLPGVPRSAPPLSVVGGRPDQVHLHGAPGGGELGLPAVRVAGPRWAPTSYGPAPAGVTGAAALGRAASVASAPAAPRQRAPHRPAPATPTSRPAGAPAPVPCRHPRLRRARRSPARRTARAPRRTRCGATDLARGRTDAAPQIVSVTGRCSAPGADPVMTGSLVALIGWSSAEAPALGAGAGVRVPRPRPLLAGRSPADPPSRCRARRTARHAPARCLVPVGSALLGSAMGRSPRRPEPATVIGNPPAACSPQPPPRDAHLDLRPSSVTT